MIAEILGGFIGYGVGLVYTITLYRLSRFSDYSLVLKGPEVEG